MSDTYEIFSLDEIKNNNTQNIADENVTDISETETYGMLHLTENADADRIPIISADNTENPVMRPVNGMVIDFTEDMNVCDEQHIEDISDECDCETVECVATDINAMVEDVDGECNAAIVCNTEIDGSVEDVEDEIFDDDNDVSAFIVECSTDESVTADANADNGSLETAFEENAEMDIRFVKGMTIVEFLRENPNVRDREILEQYFSSESVLRALRNGTIMCMHGKISL